MRDEFYADRRDLWKWTVALNEAAERKIIYVAMYTRRRVPAFPKGIREDVRNFFVQEREELDRELKCSRICRLSKEIVAFVEPYHSRMADVYFGDVCNLIRFRAIEENYLVFVDPDTGIAESNSKPEHVSLKHLALLWSTMHSGDKLLVYQHNLREKREKWTSRKRGQLGTALQVKEVAVKNEHHADVCLFCISK
jgi:hypothetical protein